MDTREENGPSLTAIEDREDGPHTKCPYGEPRTADDDWTREATIIVKGSKQRKRAQHREDDGVG